MRPRPPPQAQKPGGPQIQTQSHMGFHASRFQKGLECQGGCRLVRERTKGKVWAAQTFLSGLIKWFPDQGEGAPVDALQKSLFSRKPACSPLQEQSLAASPAPSAGGWVYIPSISKPWQPLSGDQGYQPPARTTPQEKAGPTVRRQQTRHEQDSCKPPGQPLSLVGVWGLSRRQHRGTASVVQLSLLPHWPVHSNKSKASLCQSKRQSSSPKSQHQAPPHVTALLGNS